MSILAFPFMTVPEENSSLLPMPDGEVAACRSYWQREKNVVNHSKVEARQGKSSES